MKKTANRVLTALLKLSKVITLVLHVTLQAMKCRRKALLFLASFRVTNNKLPNYIKSEYKVKIK